MWIGREVDLLLSCPSSVLESSSHCNLKVQNETDIQSLDHKTKTCTEESKIEILTNRTECLCTRDQRRSERGCHQLQWCLSSTTTRSSQEACSKCQAQHG